MADLDLVMLFADADAQRFVTTLIERGFERGCLRSIRCESIRDPMHDAGVARASATTLAPYLGMPTCRFVVVLDHHGAGHDTRASGAIESDVAEALERAGVNRERVLVVVLEPELEVTLVPVWERVLELLADKRGAAPASIPMDPRDPKGSWEGALRAYRLKASPALFAELAQSLSLTRLKEGATLERLSRRLVSWFGAAQNVG